MTAFENLLKYLYKVFSGSLYFILISLKKMHLTLLSEVNVNCARRAPEWDAQKLFQLGSTATSQKRRLSRVFVCVQSFFPAQGSPAHACSQTHHTLLTGEVRSTLGLAGQPHRSCANHFVVGEGKGFVSSSWFLLIPSNVAFLLVFLLSLSCWSLGLFLKLAMSHQELKDNCTTFAHAVGIPDLSEKFHHS